MTGSKMNINMDVMRFLLVFKLSFYHKKLPYLIPPRWQFPKVYPKISESLGIPGRTSGRKTAVGSSLIGGNRTGKRLRKGDRSL